MEKELSGSYPIVIDDRETGSLNVTREGLFWCFEATSEMSSDLVRLSVFGPNGDEGYLGVMAPENGLLRLRKKLSRSSLSAFPRSISYGGRRGSPAFRDIKSMEDITTEPLPDEPSPEAQPSRENEHPPEMQLPQEDKPAPEDEPPPKPELSHKDKPAPEKQQMPPFPPPLVWRPCGCPCSYLASLEAKQIFGSRSGVLEARDDEYLYLALPEDDSFTREELLLFKGESIILGKRHLVCRIKNGLPA